MFGLLAIIGKSTGRLGFYFVHHPGGKDTKKFYRAINAYASLEEDENPVAVYDATFWGAADEGVAWTSRRLIYKNGEQHGSVCYRDIRDVAYAENLNIITLRDESKIDVAIIATKENLEKIANVTRFMKENFKEK